MKEIHLLHIYLCTAKMLDHTTQELRDLIIEEEREKAQEQLAAKEKELEELFADNIYVHV